MIIEQELDDLMVKKIFNLKLERGAEVCLLAPEQVMHMQRGIFSDMQKEGCLVGILPSAYQSFSYSDSDASGDDDVVVHAVKLDDMNADNRCSMIALLSYWQSIQQESNAHDRSAFVLGTKNTVYSLEDRSENLLQFKKWFDELSARSEFK